MLIPIMLVYTFSLDPLIDNRELNKIKIVLESWNRQKYIWISRLDTRLAFAFRKYLIDVIEKLELHICCL